MSDSALFELIEQSEPAGGEGRDDFFISQLISAGISYDEGHFTHMFSQCVLRYGLRDTYLRVVYPLLVRIGTLWTSDSFSQCYEHFISNILRWQLAIGVGSLPQEGAASPVWLLDNTPKICR